MDKPLARQVLDMLKNEVRQDGYQPLNEGYVPNEIRGYSPNATAAQNTNTPPAAPVGGTGESPATSPSNQDQ